MDNRLTILRTFIPPNDSSYHRYAECRCSCGTTKIIREDGIKSGAVKSCGCFHDENSNIQGLRNVKHGYCRRAKKRTMGYMSWYNMHARCYNQSERSWKDYGARGIKVCGRWHRNNPNALKNFMSDMGARPEGMTLDRINNDGHYEPSNCRWATPTEQIRNRRLKRIEDFSDDELLSEVQRRNIANKLPKD